MGPEEETFIDGGGEGKGQEPKDRALSWDNKGMLKPIRGVPGYPGNLGVLPCIQPGLKEVSSIIASKQGSGWEGIQKGET